jgi:hypothetical protein
MTPKEKAEELVNKFLIETENRTYCGLYRTVAKKCALIAVDELIYETQFEVPNIRQRYWEEVKKELEKI